MTRLSNRFLAVATAIGAFALVPATALAAGGGGHNTGFTWGIEGWYIVDFVIFMFLAWFFVRGPAKKFLIGRHDRIKSQIDEATMLRKRAEIELAEYKAKLAGLTAEVEQLKTQFRADGEREKLRIEADTVAQSVTLRANVARQLRQETAVLKQELEGELVQKVLAAAETKVKAQMTPAAQREMFNNYIKDLESLEDLDQFAA